MTGVGHSTSGYHEYAGSLKLCERSTTGSRVVRRRAYKDEESYGLGPRGRLVIIETLTLTRNQTNVVGTFSMTELSPFSIFGSVALTDLNNGWKFLSAFSIMKEK